MSKQDGFPQEVNVTLKKLYLRWVEEAADAVYYGSSYDAVNDFKWLFRTLKRNKIFDPKEITNENQ